MAGFTTLNLAALLDYMRHRGIMTDEEAGTLFSMGFNPGEYVNVPHHPAAHLKAVYDKVLRVPIDYEEFIQWLANHPDVEPYIEHPSPPCFEE